MKARSFPLLLGLAALAGAVPALGQSLQYQVAAGYQWLNILGNSELFRSQTGDKAGFRLDALDLLFVDTQGWAGLDRLRISATGIGASPDSRLFIDAARGQVYRLRLLWSRSDVFNSLPGWANPLAERGIFPGQHTLDRRRQDLDLDLELFPGKGFTPLVGYRRGTYKGPARTTYHFGQDEFLLTSNLDEEVSEYRLGVGFSAGGFRGAIVQGWRRLESSNTMRLAAGAGAGNNLRPLLGRDIAAERLDLHARAQMDTPFTSANLSGQLGKRVRLVTTFSRADADSDAAETGEMVGRFASFALQRFFGSAQQAASGRANLLHWRGEGRIEVEVVPGLDATVRYRSWHRELDGHSFITTNYFDTVNFSGAFPGDVSTVLQADTAWERDDTLAEAKLTARPFPWLRLWAARGTGDEEVVVLPALAEVVVPGGQGGSFRRDVRRLAGGAEVRQGALVVGGDWIAEDADHPVVRTDFLERTRLRGHLSLTLSQLLKVVATAEKTESSNPDPTIAYAADFTHWTTRVEWQPLRPLTFYAAYDSYRGDSQLLIVRPHDLGREFSLYTEDGEGGEAGVSARFDTLTWDLGINRYRNRGNLPFELERFFTRFDFRLTEQLGVYAELERREYDEKALPQAYFDADRYGLFFRWTGQ